MHSGETRGIPQVGIQNEPGGKRQANPQDRVLKPEGTPAHSGKDYFFKEEG